jgi:hypothetical protein
MRAVRTVITVLLTIALVTGCVLLIWFSADLWRIVVEDNRHTLSNYYEVVVQALLFSAPAFLMTCILAVTCMGVVFSSERARAVKLRRICSWSLFGFAALLIASAIWLTITSRGEGAGLVVIFTGPMVGFALLVPISLGFLVAPTKYNVANKTLHPTAGNVLL